MLAKDAEHDALVVDDDAGLSAVSPNAIRDVANSLVEPAGRHVTIGDVAEPGLIDGLALARLIEREPALLAGREVEDAGEAKALEPPRGPRRKVSGEIAAVDDQRAAAVELGSGRLG